MIGTFRRWLDKLPLTDPIERQQASVFQWVLIGWIILALIDNLITLSPLFAPPPAPTPGPMPVIFLVIFSLLVLAGVLLWICPVSALVVLRRGRFKLSV